MSFSSSHRYSGPCVSCYFWVVAALSIDSILFGGSYIQMFSDTELSVSNLSWVFSLTLLTIGTVRATRDFSNRECLCPKRNCAAEKQSSGKRT
jgi:hypothetical protein